MTGQINLMVNDTPIPLDSFVSEFVERTVAGMVASLKGTGRIETLFLSIVGDTVTINLNGAMVPANPFASSIIRNTVFGMVSSLKGVGEVNRVDISVR